MCVQQRKVSTFDRQSHLFNRFFSKSNLNAVFSNLLMIQNTTFFPNNVSETETDIVIYSIYEHIFRGY